MKNPWKMMCVETHLECFREFWSLYSRWANITLQRLLAWTSVNVLMANYYKLYNILIENEVDLRKKKGSLNKRQRFSMYLVSFSLKVDLSELNCFDILLDSQDVMRNLRWPFFEGRGRNSLYCSIKTCFWLWMFSSFFLSCCVFCIAGWPWWKRQSGWGPGC